VSRKRRKKLFGAEKAEDGPPEAEGQAPASAPTPPAPDHTAVEAAPPDVVAPEADATDDAPDDQEEIVEEASPPIEIVAAEAPAVESAEDPSESPSEPVGRRIGEGRTLPRVIAVANQKGGVGKTTTSVNLSASLAELGFRTLVVDLDPQGNAGTGLGIDIRQLDASIYDVLLHDIPLDDCIEGSAVRNLFVAPSSLDLAGAEIELVPAFSREHRLRQALEQVRDDFDYVIIDCPPSLGLLTVNAFAAASEVLVPIQCEYYALEGLGQLMRNVDLVQRNLNPKLEISAVVLVMFDGRTNLALQVAEEVRAHFGDRVCQTVIPRTVRLSEAPSFGQPITTFDPTSRGATAYRELAKEVSDGTPNRAG
jgi:chromosome partitioning protein